MTTNSSEQPAEQQAMSRLVEIGEFAGELLSRCGTRDGLNIQPGSPLAADDDLSAPCQLSFAARACILSAADHLHAVCALVLKSGTLHLSAPATVIRGALECASPVLWMLSPDTSDERITRGLRWYMKDMRDGYKAVTEVGAPEPPPLQDAKERIKGVADVLGISSSTVHSGYQSTEVVSEAERCLDTQQRSNLLLIWRLCSGFAHGRAWPTMVFATATDKTSDPENPKVIVTKTENTYERVAMLATTAEVALRSAVVLYDELGTAP